MSASRCCHAGVWELRCGAVATSAGTAAWIDLCLELLRRDHGTGIAAEVTRRLVVPPHRHGRQAEYISTPLPTIPDSALAPFAVPASQDRSNAG